jgi:hypothetical protein
MFSRKKCRHEQDLQDKPPSRPLLPGPSSILFVFFRQIFHFFYLDLPLAAFSSLDLPLLVKVPEGGLEGFPPLFPPGLFGRF